MPDQEPRRGRRRSDPRLVTRPRSPRLHIAYFDEATGRTRYVPTELGSGETDHRKREEALAQFLSAGVHRPTVTGRPKRPDERLIADSVADYLTSMITREKASHVSAAFRAVHLLTWWGDLTVDSIRPETCTAYVNWRRQAKGTKGREQTSDGTIIKELGVLKAAIGDDVKNGRLTAGPTGWWMPPTPGPRDVWLTRREFAALLWASREEEKARHHLPLYLRLGIYTLGRPEALKTLRWLGQVDLVRQRIDLNPPGRNQNAKRRPTVPVTGRLSWWLRRRQAVARTPFVLELQVARPTARGKGESRHAPIGSVKKSFAAACERAAKRFDALAAKAVEAGDRRAAEDAAESAAKLRMTTPYTLRHTGATWMAQAGVDLHKVAGWMGHSYTKTTELYAKHHPDFLEDAATAVTRGSV